MGIPASLLLASAELLRVHSPRPLQAEATPEALVPWETPVEGFFIRSHHGVPAVDASRWTVTIDGLVDHPVTLTLADLRKRPPQAFHAVLECSGNGRALQVPHASGVQWLSGAVGNAEWTGVSLGQLLDLAGVKPEARFARLAGADMPAYPATPAFVRSVPLAKLRDPGTMLAYALNREPLPLLHGGPLRLVLPNWYGENWTKWVNHITLTAAEDEGFFMKKAYRIPKEPVKPGEPWDAATGRPIEQLLVQALITEPRTEAPVRAGVVTVRGKTFSGAGLVKAVELSADDGRTWLPATVEPQHADGGWQDFAGSVTFPAAGQGTVLARATDASGATQPVEQTWNPGGYVRNAADRVAVTVVTAQMEPQASASTILNDKCLTCHAASLIDEQRLGAAGWEKVLQKMAGFGVALTAAEKAALLPYLARQMPDAALTPPVPAGYGRLRDELAARPDQGDAKAGAVLFASTCAPCHGADAAGNIGPRLTGRIIPWRDFQSAVQYGQRTMPALGASVGAGSVAALYAYLQGAPP